MNGTWDIDPGALRHELVLQAATPVPDGQGGHAPQWSEVTRLFARIVPAGARSGVRADQVQQAVTHRVTIRARGDVSSGMRFLWGERLLEILSIHDPDEEGRYLLCTTREAGR